VAAYNNTIEKAETLRLLRGPAAWLLFLFFVTGAATIVLASGELPAVFALIGLALAAVTLGSVVFALRHYTMFWFLCWFVPIVPLFALSEPIRVGAISLIAVMFVYSLAYALTFGVILVARERFLRWVQ
jgi:hypothetical protein